MAEAPVAPGPPKTLRGIYQEVRTAFRQTPRVMGLVWAADARSALGIMLLSFLGALLPLAIAWIGKLIIDGVLAASASNDPAARAHVMQLVGAELGLHPFPTPRAIITQGDEWVASLLRDAWELLPISTVISKSAPIDYQMAAIDAVLAHGSAPPDPAIQPLLPDRRRSLRSAERFARLVQHAGHSKLWSALHDLPEPTYKSMADRTGLKLNTLKNYRAQLIDELKLHGLNDPTLRDMHLFAVRCWAFLEPFVRNVSRPS